MQTTFGISTTRGWKFVPIRVALIELIARIEYIQSCRYRYQPITHRPSGSTTLSDHLKVLSSLGQTTVAKARFNPVLVSGEKLINDVYG